MPFTFSHPAIILPLNKILKNYVSLTGLIVGSIVPDFEYFLRMRIKSEYSHTLIGNIWFNLPLGIIICFIFHNVVKDSLVNNLPLFIQKRLGGVIGFQWTNYFNRKWLVVSLSLVIGGYSHILWDSFTHHDAYFVNLLSLDRIIILEIKLTKILQHFSSLAGAIVIAAYFISINPDNVKLIRPKGFYWVKILLLFFLFVIIRFLFGLKITEYGNVIVSCIASIMLSLIIISFFEKKKLDNIFSKKSD